MINPTRATPRGSHALAGSRHGNLASGTGRHGHDNNNAVIAHVESSAGRVNDPTRKRPSLIKGQRVQGTLPCWEVRVSGIDNVRRFAEGIRREESAVQAAVTERWSNGPVEGHVNRLKTIKRQMYGRAGFVLLRARVLNAA